MTFSRHFYIYLSVGETKLSYVYTYEVLKNHYSKYRRNFLFSKTAEIARTQEVIEINNCQGCNNEPFDGDSFCRQCGVELPDQDMFECPECDAEVFEEDSFCFSCGTKFEGLQEEQEELSGEAPATPEAAPAEPQVAPAAPEVAPEQPSAPAPAAPQPPAQPAAPQPPQQPGQGF